METSIPRTRGPLDTCAQHQPKTESVSSAEPAGTSQSLSSVIESIEDLKKLVLVLGNAAADLIEQELRCEFRDSLGHSLRMNQSFIALGNALQSATTYAEEHSK